MAVTEGIWAQMEGHPCMHTLGQNEQGQHMDDWKAVRAGRVFFTIPLSKLFSYKVIFIDLDFFKQNQL